MAELDQHPNRGTQNAKKSPDIILPSSSGITLLGIKKATLTLLALSTLSQGSALADTREQADNHRDIDWVPRERLSKSERDKLPAGCCGAYVSPYQPDPDADTIERSKIEAEANSTSASGGQNITLEGDVELRQGSRMLRTQRAELNTETGKLTLEDGVMLREDGLLIVAERAQMQRDSGDASLDSAEFVLHESRLHGHAGKLEKFGDRLLRLTDGSFSTCEPNHEFWRMEASELEIHPEQDYGTAKHARLLIKDIPVLYIPYLAFPIGDKRKSGLLFPSLGSSSRNGLELSQPIYWNIAPQMDATLTPRFMEKRGTLWDATARHLSPYFYTQVSGGFLAGDDGGYDKRAESAIASGEQTPNEAYPYKGKDRWLIHLAQTGGKRSRLKTRIDYTDISDVDYLRDITGSDSDISRQSRISKFGEISYSADAWEVGASAEEVRYLNESKQKPYKQLPHVFARGNFRLGDWQVDLDNQLTRFAVSEYYDRATDQLVEGERFNTDYGLTWNKRWQWGFFKPRLGVKTLSYQLEQADHPTAEAVANDSEYSSSPALVVPQGSVDMGMFFERFGNLGGAEFIQTLEPRLFYFYSDYEDHSELYAPLNAHNKFLNFDTQYVTFDYNQLFRTTRFSGYDRIDDANRLSAGLTSRFISPLTGIEHLAVSVGQIYRFTSPRVTLNPEYQPEQERYAQSELAGRIAARAGDYLQISGSWLYNQHDDAISNAGASIEYSDDSDRLVSLTYNYKRNVQDLDGDAELDPMQANRSRNQLDAGAFIPLNNSWSIIARAHYDLTFDQELDTFAGFEYSDCCYRVRLLWRKWLNFDYNQGKRLDNLDGNDYDNGFFIDLQLKGLASISERVGNLLSKTILGYDEREKNLR